MNSPLQTHALEKRFGRLPALRDVTLTVPEGAMFALIGPNGAGKTTLLKTVLNILPPTSGCAQVVGTASRQLGPREFAQIGYVADGRQLPDWMTVQQWLDYLAPFYPQWDRALAATLVLQLHLPPAQRLGHLSRGTRMKAALAASLAYRPRLLILDEPFSGLDALVRDELIESLLDRATGATVVISSHDLADIETFATHAAFLNAGVLSFAEEMHSLSARFRAVEVTLSQPGAIPRPWPATWLHVETSPTVLRFVDTAFDEWETPERLRALFPSARDIAFHPMPLRTIFTTLAKPSREAA